MKKAAFLLIVVAMLLIINNLVHSILQTWEQQSYLTQAKNSLVQEQKRHEMINQQLHQASEPQFVQEEARDKLLLVKPGEQLVIIPNGLINPISDKPKRTQAQKPHWQEWVDYFLN